MSPDLIHVPGCQQELSPWKVPPHIHDFTGVFLVDIHHWHQVYVYGNFIQQQFAGNSPTPMLNIFPLFIPQRMPPRDVGEKLGGVQVTLLSYSTVSQLLSSK